MRHLLRQFPARVALYVLASLVLVGVRASWRPPREPAIIGGLLLFMVGCYAAADALWRRRLRVRPSDPADVARGRRLAQQAAFFWGAGMVLWKMADTVPRYWAGADDFMRPLGRTLWELYEQAYFGVPFAVLFGVMMHAMLGWSWSQAQKSDASRADGR